VPPVPSLGDEFGQAVIDPFAVNVAGQPGPLDYGAYMALPADARGNDEADVVDQLFTRSLLEWLGWVAGDWRYNRPEAGAGKTVQRPEYRVVAEAATAFIVEDKASANDWHPSYLAQMRRYATGTPGYALWTNARVLHLFRFLPDGSYDTLASVVIEGLFGNQQAIDQSEQLAALAFLRGVLGKERFTTFDGYVAAASADDPRVALDSPAALNEFINGSQAVLDAIGTAAAVQLRAGLASAPSRREHEMEVAEELGEVNAELMGHEYTPAQQTQLEALAATATHLLGSLAPDDIAHDDITGLNAQQRRDVDSWSENVLKLDTKQRLIEWEERTHGRLEDAFAIWLRQQPDQDPDKATLDRYAAQVAYVLFVRLMLVRILEDKEIITPRILSDGGFEAWRDLVSAQFSPRGATGLVDIHGGPFLSILFTTVGSYYRHFFQQPIFDWYQPDDFTLVKLLAHLNRYDFSQITDDVIGFTYEHYVDRQGRKQKGQFLTRSGLVDYVLRRAGYSGNAVIGKKLLDHACGSGSFLIHAVRELRSALITRTAEISGGAVSEADLQGGDSEARRSFATELLQYVGTDLVGIDIDPFACYLAELNLLVQLLDEITLLWSTGEEAPIDRFLVFNADGLALPDSILHSSLNEPTLTDPEENVLDESWPVKARQGPFAAGFDFVVANPPYVTPKKQESLSTAGEQPFFRDVLAGDLNLYLLFLRLGEHYLADGGMATFIVPLGLTGDEGAQAARQLLTARRCRLAHLTRFYSGTVLFPEVDQWVMIVGFAAGDPDREAPDINVRGGLTEVDAEASGVTQPAARVIDVVPPPSQDELPQAVRWRAPWLNVADAGAFDVWGAVCGVAEGYLHSPIDEYADVRQGDVNTTMVKDLVRADPGDNGIARYAGSSARPFAPLGEPEQWLEPPDEDPGVEPGTTLHRLAHLDETESGFVMQVQANLHIGRRLRATWFERGPGDTKAFVHSLWRFTSREGHDREAKALMGLFSSSLLNYLYGIWSTNFNIQMNVLRRLPRPSIESFPIEDFAGPVDTALEARRSIAELLENGGRFDDAAATLTLDPRGLLPESGVRSVTLRTAQLNGDLERPAGGSQRVDRLLGEGRLTFPDQAYGEILRIFLEASGVVQWAGIENDLLVPRREDAGMWQAFFEERQTEGAAAIEALSKAISDIDAAAFMWYGISEDSGLRPVVEAMLPWEYGRAREAYRAAAGDEPPADLAVVSDE
jgi:hypothetical protein